MNAINCPNCNVALPAAEVDEGWCEQCEKKLPPFVIHQTSPGGGQAGLAKKAETKKRPPGTLVGVFIGGVIIAVLMTGPMRSTGLLVQLVVNFTVVMITVGTSQAVARLSSTGRQ